MQTAVCLLIFEWVGGLLAVIVSLVASFERRRAVPAEARRVPWLMLCLATVGLSGLYFRLYPPRSQGFLGTLGSVGVCVKQLFEYRFALSVLLTAYVALVNQVCVFELGG